MKILYERTKRNRDKTVRCYLTLNCNAMCEFCSAGIPNLRPERRKVWIPAEVWAEGINRRNRATVLAGGEPFLYPQFPELTSRIRKDIKVEIYTNLLAPIDEFLKSANRKYSFLVSLHPATKDLDKWKEKLDILADEGHGIRVHVVTRSGDKPLIDFLSHSGIVGKYKTALQGDQRNGVKSRKDTKIGEKIYDCSTSIYLYGPDGYRYHCVTSLGGGFEKWRREHISEPDGQDWSKQKCSLFGHCVGCDNNIEGKVTES